MLTRSQVAKRLGKSIATVRRLEGTALHPVLDSDGVHRFDPEEVELLADGGRSRVLRAEPREREPARSPWFEAELARRGPLLDDGEDDDRDDCEAQTEVLERREAELARLEGLAREREQQLDARERNLNERESVVTREREESAAVALRSDRDFRRVVRAQVSDLLEQLDRLSPAAVAKILTDDDLEFLATVVKDDLD